MAKLFSLVKRYNFNETQLKIQERGQAVLRSEIEKQFRREGVPLYETESMHSMKDAAGWIRDDIFFSKETAVAKVKKQGNVNKVKSEDAEEIIRAVNNEIRYNPKIEFNV